MWVSLRSESFSGSGGTKLLSLEESPLAEEYHVAGSGPASLQDIPSAGLVPRFRVRRTPVRKQPAVVSLFEKLQLARALFLAIEEVLLSFKIACW
jgi:hypothetical protein